MVKQISDNEIHLLIKYIKSVLWRAVKRLSYIQDARCLKVKRNFLPSECFCWCVRKYTFIKNFNLPKSINNL